jgi:MinD superfamily P-loop ATPase
MLYRDKQRVFSTAQLKMGSGASGKLVSAVKTQLADHAPPDVELAVVDGSPGIGCPVIASISGVDYVLVVAEPTVSGIHDMQRILETAAHFGVSCGVCINKYDTAPEQAKVIDSTCHTMGVEVLGRIPYDETVIRALNQCESIARYPDSPAGKEIKKLWQRISQTVLPSPGALDDM